MPLIEKNNFTEICFADGKCQEKSRESDQIDQGGRGLCLNPCLLSGCVGVGEDLGVHKKNIYWPQEKTSFAFKKRNSTAEGRVPEKIGEKYGLLRG